MSAYLIAEVVWKDDAARQQYLAGFGRTLEPYGGRVAFAGPAENIEGDWHPALLALVEFGSLEQARAWYRSAEYATVKEFRHRGADSKIVLVGSA
ncbi:MAG: DUF1330 domain-containing protein [Chloroflexi bacterium]|nr:DUF1330 domain-containing protein [Chloroflexota bacterium]MBV9545889.1 DUF1330 domain-containing protein [Chloroflexota bacterium]